LGKHLKFTEQQRNFQLEASERLPWRKCLWVALYRMARISAGWDR
jgi:hypothetical protein